MENENSVLTVTYPSLYLAGLDNISVMFLGMNDQQLERIQEIVSKGPKGTDEVLNELLWGPPVVTLSKLNRDAGITSAKNGH